MGLALQVDDLKRQCEVHLDDTSREALLERHIRAATRIVEDHIGRFLLPISLELRLPRWCHPIILPAAPIRSVTEVVYLDDAHAEQTVDVANWTFDPSSTGGGVFFDDFSLPTLSSRPSPVRVRFMAGYDDQMQSGAGDDPQLLADPLDEQMVALLAANWFIHRESITELDLKSAPDSFWMIAAKRRIYR
ncbi:MAG: hypothetical protein OEQ29_01680 [Alphaproteobacteria bacterium]|nr:hypothetical protein [Alphaproteobacteria bacterium]